MIMKVEYVATYETEADGPGGRRLIKTSVRRDTVDQLRQYFEGLRRREPNRLIQNQVVDKLTTTSERVDVVL